MITHLRINLKHLCSFLALFLALFRAPAFSLYLCLTISFLSIVVKARTHEVGTTESVRDGDGLSSKDIDQPIKLKHMRYKHI